MKTKTKGTIAAIAVIGAVSAGIGAAAISKKKAPTTTPSECPPPCGTYSTYIRNSDGSQMGATPVEQVEGLKPTGVNTTFVDVAGCTTKTVEIYSTSGTLDTEWYVTYNNVLYGISSELCSQQPCPNSCSADSDCSGCGADFVCEGGQCVKQIPAVIDAPLSVDIQSRVQYTTNCSFYFIYETCNKCNGSYDPYFGSAGLDVYVRDKYGRGIPNIPISISSSVVNPNLEFSFTVFDPTNNTFKEYTSGATATATTDSTGRVQISVEGKTMPIGWDNIQNSNFPCTGCSAQGTEGAQGPLSFGQFNFKVLGTQISAITLITDTVYYSAAFGEC